MSERTPTQGPSLRDLQQDFWQLISAPTGVAEALDVQPGRTRLVSTIVSDARAAAVPRLDIYANMYFYRLRDNLAGDFPRLAEVIGETAFHNLATDYLFACPSQHPSARHVGARLAAFLRTHSLSTTTAPVRPWLSDLAALEWARVDVHDRADDAVLTLAHLQASAARGFVDLSLCLVGAHALVPAEFAVETVWRALQHEEEAQEPLLASEPTLLVWRTEDLRVQHRRVNTDELGLLPALTEGLSFVALCELLMREHSAEQAAHKAMMLLADWTQAGLLVRV